MSIPIEHNISNLQELFGTKSSELNLRKHLIRKNVYPHFIGNTLTLIYGRVDTGFFSFSAPAD